MLSLKFDEVCAFLKQDVAQEPKLITAVDRLLGLALVCSHALLPEELAAVLPALGVKGEVVQAGRWLYDRLTAKREKEYTKRLMRIRVAHGLLVYTAFFEYLDDRLTKSVRAELTRHSEKIRLSDDLPAVRIDGIRARPAVLGDFDEVAIPKPTESFNDQIKRHAGLWKRLADHFGKTLQELPLWSELPKREQSDLLRSLERAPQEVPAIFHGQCFELAARFPDFAIWSNLGEFERTRDLIAAKSGETLDRLKSYLKHYQELSNQTAQRIDVGLSQLHDAVTAIPRLLEIDRAPDLLSSLAKSYRAELDKPLIPEDQSAEESGARLSFPTIRGSFIPQAFSVRQHIDTGQKVGVNETWDGVPRREGLNQFLLRHLMSPYSTQCPMVILGEPGIGKSLLTKVLAGQLMSDYLTVVRVALREVDAEAEISKQIESAIHGATHMTDAWRRLSGALKINPLLVILDGYDELLQASGLVLSNYLMKVQQFQQTEFVQDRPVRVIVTSRLTLIDKATIPLGAMVLRLLPFDDARQVAWISIWNHANREYFETTGVSRFALPERTQEGGAQSIRLLAEQPLLLSMLALYDSHQNQLRRSHSLDRTELYDNLLRRFVARQRSKDDKFKNASESERAKVVEEDMRRLGVAAFGMFNRVKPWIYDEELNEDLRFFGLEQTFGPEHEQPAGERAIGKLSQADRVLGGFFFIHKAKAQHAVDSAQALQAAAYEFLHLTFGEFLAADFVLRVVLREMEALSPAGANQALREKLERLSNSADAFDKSWFATLIHTPLYTRPVILEMMREWLGHLLAKSSLSIESFREALDSTLLKQIGRLLNRKELPSVLSAEASTSAQVGAFEVYPMLGHVAIYSINLLMLRVVVCNAPYTFDESKFASYKGGARPWDRLTHLWRSWLSTAGLEDITAAIQVTNRVGALVTLIPREKLVSQKSSTSLQSVHSVAMILADNVVAGLSGLQLWDLKAPGSPEISDIASRLKSENIEPALQVGIRQLLVMDRTSKDADAILVLAKETLKLAIAADDLQALDQLSPVFQRLRGHVQLSSLMPQEAQLGAHSKAGISTEQAAQFAYSHPRAVVPLLNIISSLHGPHGANEFVRIFLQHALPSAAPHSLEQIERSPQLQAAWDELLEMPQFEQFSKFFADTLPLSLVIDRALDPHHVANLSRTNPGAALVTLKLAREAGRRRQFKQAGIDDVARQIATWDAITLFAGHPAIALQWLRLAREAGGPRFIGRFDAEICEHLYRDEFLIHMNKRNPELARALLVLAMELNPASSARLPTTMIVRTFEARELLGHCGPDADVDLLRLREVTPQLASSISDEHPKWTPQLTRRDDLFELLRKGPAAFSIPLYLCRCLTGEAQEDLLKCLAEVLDRGIEEGLSLTALPIHALPDLRWLAERAKGSALATSLRQLDREQERGSGNLRGFIERLTQPHA